ncbi:MAG TPA: tetratricopeptide repeat protein [Thermoanaerobaculia bacterium]
MKLKSMALLTLVFTLGITVGAVAARRGVDSTRYRSKSKQEAALALLETAKKQAGKGSWEQIGVGRVYYLSGQKAEGQALFDAVTSKKPEAGDWFRIGRVYREAGEWDKAKAAFDKALQMEKGDEKWLSEVGAYYNLEGDRETAERMFDQSYKIETEDVWPTLNMASSYLGVEPQRW